MPVGRHIDAFTAAAVLGGAVLVAALWQANPALGALALVILVLGLWARAKEAGVTI